MKKLTLSAAMLTLLGTTAFAADPFTLSSSSFKDGTKLGPGAKITKSAIKRHNGRWENLLGNRRSVRDQWRELRLTLQERGPAQRTFGLIVRAYDDGVAFRYDLPERSVALVREDHGVAARGDAGAHRRPSDLMSVDRHPRRRSQAAH